jgi:hypothetical protein
VKFFQLIFGIVLLLPGACSIFFAIGLMSDPAVDSGYLGVGAIIWVPCLIISAYAIRFLARTFGK